MVKKCRALEGAFYFRKIAPIENRVFFEVSTSHFGRLLQSSNGVLLNIHGNTDITFLKCVPFPLPIGDLG